MKPKDLYNRFRNEVFDKVDPFLWSEDEVYEYMDDAQVQLVRILRGLADASTPEVSQLKLKAGQKFAPIHKAVLRIRTAQRADTAAYLDLKNLEDFQTGNGLTGDLTRQNDYGNIASVRLDASVGEPRVLVLGMERNKVRVSPIPDKDYAVDLVVFRLPLQTLCCKSDTLEIDDQHHVHLLLWMKHRAYSKQDSETYDKGKATEFFNAFFDYAERARQEKERAEYKPQAIFYGGIP